MHRFVNFKGFADAEISRNYLSFFGLQLSTSVRLLLLLALALVPACHAGETREERVSRLTRERADLVSEERDWVAAVDRYTREIDARYAASEEAVKSRFAAATKAKVGPSAERYHDLLSDERAVDDRAAQDLNPEIESAKADFLEADRVAREAYEPKERAYLERLSDARRRTADRCKLKRQRGIEAFAARRRALDDAIVAAGGERPPPSP